MKCPNCGAENPEAKRYCSDCGAEIGDSAVDTGTVRDAAIVPADPEIQFFPITGPGLWVTKHKRIDGEVAHLIYPKHQVTLEAKEAGLAVDVSLVLQKLGFDRKVKDVKMTDVEYGFIEVFLGPPPTESQKRTFVENDSVALSKATMTEVLPENLEPEKSVSASSALPLRVSASVRLVSFSETGKVKQVVESSEGQKEEGA